MLILPIKKKWFDMILKGIKKEEYREIKPYYNSRILSLFGAVISNDELLQESAVVQPIIFRNGYSKNSPELLTNCSLSIKEGLPEWGAKPGIKYYTLQIREILETKNIKSI